MSKRSSRRRGGRTGAPAAGAAKHAAPEAAKAAKAATNRPETQQTAGLPRGYAIAGVVLLIVIAIALAWYGMRPRAASPPALPAPAAKIAAADAAPAAQFVGGRACAGCHADAWNAWKGSDHDLAMQTADDKSVLGDFSGARFSYAGTTSTFFRRDGKYYVNTDGPDGKLADFEIKYTFGVHPLQQYLIDFPGGRKQALGIAWDSRPKAAGGQRWFHLYPGQAIHAGDPLHWTGINQNWNFMCAECHSTNVRKQFDARSNHFDTTWAEINVSCEACHGPGSNHVAWAGRDADARRADATRGLVIALDERKGATWLPVAETGNTRRSVPRTASREIDTCGRCHSRAARLTDDYVYGAPLQDSRRPALIDRALYTDDGQMRDEVYNWGSFLQSKMAAAGVTCSDCHEPHSLKLRAAGNALCTNCHQAARFDAVAHTHHAPGSAGAACAACHMPTRTYMIVDPRHDHSIRIPRPDLSVTLGTPNACNDCHTRKSAQWAADAVTRWFGETRHGYQTYAGALHAGTDGTPDARTALTRVIEDRSQPAIARASAIQRLGAWLTPTTLEVVSRALDDADPGVRMAAVEALGAADPPYRATKLAPLLSDPVRGVRITAARELAGPPERSLSGVDRTRFEQALAEYVAVQEYNADRPEGRASLGNLYAMRGDYEAAAMQLRKAIEIEPSFVAAYVNLADLARARGAETEAEAILRQGLAKSPNAAALHHALGLSLSRQKRTPDALRELKQATVLAPDDARYVYVYAVALHDAGQAAEAVKLMQGALMRHPYDRDLLSGLVFYAAETRDRAAALRYVATLRALEPDNQDYARLAARIQGVPAQDPQLR